MKKIYLATFVFIFLLVSVWLMAEKAGKNPVTVTNVLADMKTEVQEVGISGIEGTEGTTNTFYGYNAGASITSGNSNTFVGANAGDSDTTGNYNTFLGGWAGNSNISGYGNVFLGNYAGSINNGSENTFIGCFSGSYNTTGYYNTFLGYEAGNSNETGHSNTYLGYAAGYYNETGSNNIFIGYMAGLWAIGSNKLYIDNSSTSSPLIYGEFDNNKVKINGKLGIATTPINYPLEMATGAYCDGSTWVSGSSRSLKENIESLSTGEALDALDKLNPVKFNYKVNKTDQHLGFIAEDVPDLVATPDRKGMDPMDITAVLTKVLQEQQNLIREQQKIISDLQERMAKLEKN